MDYNAAMLPSEILSPLAIELARRPLSEAGPLVITAPTSSATRSLLSGVTSAQLFNVPIRDPQSASAVLAALWLGHDALDEGHRIAQDIAPPTGSFWHAIMHRREADFSNAKYWYARCRTHPVNKSLGRVTSSLAGDCADDSSRPSIDFDRMERKRIRRSCRIGT